MNWLRQREWPWWQAGLLLGAISMIAFYTANTALGTSTTFVRATGMILNLIVPEHVATNVHYKAIKPVFDWQFLLVIGIPIGAFLSARMSQGAVHFSAKLPEAWVNRFGTSPARRWTIGVIGGILVGFGARMADG
jgi:hypothetical protein